MSRRDGSVRWRDIVAESAAGVLQRPGRSVATAAGTALGVGALVAILGLATTAAGQVSERFSLLEATQVLVVETDASDVVGSAFPDDAEARVRAINGVQSAGTFWRWSQESQPEVSARLGDDGLTTNAEVFAVSPGLFDAAEIRVESGVPFDQIHEDRAERVAVVSTVVANQLALPDLSLRPAVFLGDEAFTVVGVMSTPSRLPQLGFAVLVPNATGQDVFGLAEPAEMLVRTDVGAAAVAAEQVGIALRPDAPEATRAIPPPRVGALEEDVQTTLSAVALGLALVAVAAGCLSIFNTMTVSTLERVPEIGLRRALGARPRHIVAQLVGEASVLGLIGALCGTAVGVIVVVVTAVVREWTAVLDPAFVLPLPVAGALVGAIGGVVPALRAARTEPAAALRR